MTHDELADKVRELELASVGTTLLLVQKSSLLTQAQQCKARVLNENCFP